MTLSRRGFMGAGAALLAAVVRGGKVFTGYESTATGGFWSKLFS